MAINRMLDYIHALDNAMTEIRQACKKMGMEVADTPLPTIEIYDIDSDGKNVTTQNGEKDQGAGKEG